MGNDSIGTDFPNQQARLRRFLKEYQNIPEGFYGAAIINNTLEYADHAMASGDVIKIILAYEKMTEIE